MSFEEEDSVPPTPETIARAQELEHWFALNGFHDTEVSPDALGGMGVEVFSDHGQRRACAMVFNVGAEFILWASRAETHGCRKLDERSMADAIAFLHSGPVATPPPKP